MTGDLPLFAVEEHTEDNWRLVSLRRALFRDIIGEHGPDRDLPSLRVRRVKTAEEAKTLADPHDWGLWLKGVAEKIIWVPIQEAER